MVNINLEKDDIVLALKKYILEIVERKKEKNRFTKFDSPNDLFLGILGEISFEKHLINLGFNKNTDFVKLDDKKEDSKFENYFNKIGNKVYDKCDFLIKLFFDKNGEPIDLMKIDVKTQKYIGNYDENWQFAINQNTVNKIKEETSIINQFVFIFSKNGIEDFIDIDIENKNIEELRLIYKNIENNLKKNTIKLEILGCISPEKFLTLSEEFSEGEIFRVNKGTSLNSFKTIAPMSRIYLKYLSNIEKIIPPRKIDFDIQSINNYKKIFKNENKYVKIESENNSCLFPYNKVYLNNQHNNFQQLLNNINMEKNRKGIKNKRWTIKNY